MRQYAMRMLMNPDCTPLHAARRTALAVWRPGLRGIWQTCLTVLTVILAAPARPDALDVLIREEMANQHLPGLAVAVIRQGKAVDVRTYGMANLETRTPVSRDSVFRLASLSKQFLATGVMLLVQDGKLTLDDRLDRHLDDLPETWRAMTVRQALSHTAGLPNEAPGFDPYRNQPAAERVNRARDMSLLSVPGSRFAYSNLGYDIVVMLIERLSGQAVGDFMQQRLFAPLGMNSTRTTDTQQVIPERVSGYLYRDGAMRNAPPLVATRSGGLFLSTLSDLMQWDAAINSARIVSRDIQQALWSGTKLTDGSVSPYGLAWWVDEYKGHRRVRHGGSNPGFRTEYTRFVDDHLNVIVLTNGDAARPDYLALEIAGLYVKGLEQPERKSIRLTAEQLSRWTGRYELGTGNFVVIGLDPPGLSIRAVDGGTQFRLVPERPDTFYISRDESYVFSPDRLTLRFENTVVEGRRVPESSR